MAWTNVTREQFQIFDDHVEHTPTGARFNAYPRQPDIASENLGQADYRLENGDDYRIADIRTVAAQLLRERLQA